MKPQDKGHWHITKSEGLRWSKATGFSFNISYVQQAIQISISFNSVVSSGEAWEKKSLDKNSSGVHQMARVRFSRS